MNEINKQIMRKIRPAIITVIIMVVFIGFYMLTAPQVNAGKESQFIELDRDVIKYTEFINAERIYIITVKDVSSEKEYLLFVNTEGGIVVKEK